MHPELTSASLEDQRATVERALALGGRHVDVGQRGDEGHVVLGDPEGNEFCVIEPGNRFLAGCGFLGALSCDGSRAVGLLLERGAGLAAGVGPGRGDRDPVAPRRSEDHLGRPAAGPGARPEPGPLRPRGGRRPAAEVERLVALGATRIGGQETAVELADPDGGAFAVPAR